MTQNGFENLLGGSLPGKRFQIQVLWIEALELQSAVRTRHQPHGGRKRSGSLDFQSKCFLAGRAARKRITADHKKLSPKEGRAKERLSLKIPRIKWSWVGPDIMS
jgi:hypothetical protein